MKKEQADQWLEANTFQCALGRVSPQQCEALRKRPRFDETLNLSVSVPVMPRECENCTEWQAKIASLQGTKPSKPLGVCKVDGCNEAAKVKGMCKRHYAQWYYNKNKEIGRKIREMNEKKEVSICQDCGKEFEPYVRGAITVRNCCPECLGKRVAKSYQQRESGGAIKKPARRRRNGKVKLVFDKAICEKLQLRERLEKAARRSFRSPDMQALAYIVEGLEADGIVGVDKNEEK